LRAALLFTLSAVARALLITLSAVARALLLTLSVVAPAFKFHYRLLRARISSKSSIFNSIFLFTAERTQNPGKNGKNVPTDTTDSKKPTWISDIFQGIFTSETRCLNCETVTSKDEDFFDLSIDVEQNTSVTSCLRNFSNTETLCSDNKFQCDSCCTLQEAHVNILIF
jgi:hypothetical protein